MLDFTQVWAGPFCTQNLAHLGAEVIRVETMARTPCVTRLIPPFADNEPDPGRAGYFNQYNQGKSSIFLNLRKREAVHLAYDLVEHCDVVTDNVSAGVIDKLGLGYHKLRTIKAASWRPTRPTGPAATTTSGSPIAVATEEEWHALCHAIGQPGLATDARFKRAELRK